MATIKSIEFDDNEEPQSVVVKLSPTEALFMSLVLGRQNGVTANGLMTGGDAACAELYSTFTSGFFDRFWFGGIDEAKDELA